MVVSAIDTNVLVTLFKADKLADVTTAQNALETASEMGKLIISPVVYAELLAAPRTDQSFIEVFLKDTSIHVEWRVSRAIWEHAASAFKDYAEQRRKTKGDSGPRRILADFVIGAHACAFASAFLTFDSRVYKKAFPKLNIVALKAV